MDLITISDKVKYYMRPVNLDDISTPHRAFMHSVTWAC